MKISLDLDDTLLDITTPAIAHVKEKHKVELTPQEITSWNFFSDHFPPVMTLWSKPETFANAKLIPGAITFVQKLINLVGKDNIQIVTASLSDDVITTKNEIIKHKLFDLKVVHTKHLKKSLFTEDTILIDDALHNINDHIATTGCKGILYNRNNIYGWNKIHAGLHPNAIKAVSYNQIINIIKQEMLKD